MNKMKRMALQLLMIIFPVFCACTNGTTGATTSELPVSETQVGTNVGNPTPPGKNLITFQVAETTATPPSCKMTPKGNTQVCKVTPSQYELGILAMDLIECHDETGAATDCELTSLAEVSQRVSLYKGEVETIAVNDAVTTFSHDWVIPADTKIMAGGLQAVVAYIGAEFPEESDDAQNAAAIMPALRGVPYRICATPHELVTEDQLTAYCGSADTQMGDVKFDFNHDGVYGFLDLSTVTEDSLQETSVRPENYDAEAVASLLAVALSELDLRPWLFTTTADYGQSGFFAPIMQFENPVEMSSATANTKLNVALDVSQTILFQDGQGLEANHMVCVQSLSGKTCPDGDDDPLSVGVYNPFYDGYFKSLPPSAQVTVE